MPLRVFPVDPSGSPHFADDFGYVRPGSSHAHQGIDIFAAKGTAVHAPDDGALRFAIDPLGGQVFYLAAPDGVVYYAAHLSAYEGGAPRDVLAGDVVGYVGTSGNAQGTSPHLHFERHPGGGAATDPFAELAALAPPGAATGPSHGGAVAMPALSLAAKGLVQAYTAANPGVAVPADGLELAFAWSLLEGAWTAYFRGSNNYGSIHATKGFRAAHAAQKGYGELAFLDTHSGAPGTGPHGEYIARMRIYPSLVEGARDFLANVGRMTDLGTVKTADAFAEDLYVGGYYGGRHPVSASEPPRTPSAQRSQARSDGTLNASDNANIGEGAQAVSSRLGDATKALADAQAEQGDPAAIAFGPFAPLAERLTPSPLYAPHTLDHARALLGPAADVAPAGAITLAQAMAAPGGDGVWLYGPGFAPTPGPPPPKPPAPFVAASSPLVRASLGAAGGAALAVLGGILLRR